MRGEETKGQCAERYLYVTEGSAQCTYIIGHGGKHRTIRGDLWHSATAEQRRPSGQGIPVAERLIELIRERTELGIEKYGEPLTTHNGRDPMIDALQESVDLNQYLMQVILERDDQIVHLSDGQIKPLADYLLSIGGPDRDESACEMAVRLLKGFDDMAPERSDL